MPDGTINLPLIGEVEADFISIDQLTKKLTSLYGQQLIRPDLFITLKNRRDIRVSVIGEVNRPGLYNLSEADDSSSGLNKDSYIFPTIIDAISKAGGITPRSDIGSVRIERRIENEKIKYKETRIDLVKLLMKGDQSQNLILFDGDIVEIPEVVNNKNFSRKVLQIAKGNLSPKTITINVVGAVEKPGEYKVKPNTPLMKGILVANGLKPFEASHNNVQLLRIRSNGSISVKKFKFNINEELSYDSNPPLLDGDLIKVNKNNFSKVSGGIRTISQPFADILSSYSLFKLINE